MSGASGLQPSYLIEYSSNHSSLVNIELADSSPKSVEEEKKTEFSSSAEFLTICSGDNVEKIPTKQKKVEELSAFTFCPDIEKHFNILGKIGVGSFSSVYKAVSKKNLKTVAIKRIYSVSSTSRVKNEVHFLREYGGQNNVISLLGGLRHGGEVLLVLPYIEHDDFPKLIFEMDESMIREYLKALFTALKHLHRHGIIHRDVKPVNFLTNLQNKRFYLIDFGLAQYQHESRESKSTSTEDHVNTRKRKRLSFEPIIERTFKRPKISEEPPEESPFASESPLLLPDLKKKQNLTKIAMQLHINKLTSNALARAKETVCLESDKTERNRELERVIRKQGLDHVTRDLVRKKKTAAKGGTRGFRAPEVLMRYIDQTTAIDIWSAGVILLCILSTRYPFFQSPCYMSGLAEIVAVCGAKKVQEVATLLGKRVTLPLDHEKVDWKHLTNTLRSCYPLCIDDSIYDLLDKCLDINPFTRITADSALLHKFITKENDPL